MRAAQRLEIAMQTAELLREQSPLVGTTQFEDDLVRLVQGFLQANRLTQPAAARGIAPVS